MRLPSSWWPASAETSWLMPSSMSPSDTKQNTKWSNGLVPASASGSNRPRSRRGAAGLARARGVRAAGGHCHADRVADALAERAGGGLHAGGEPVLRVPGGDAAPGPQRLEVIHGQAVAGQVQLDIQGQAGVPAAQYEAVPARPVRVGRVVPHHPL